MKHARVVASTEARIANAALGATNLLADVEIRATHRLLNINWTQLGAMLHRVFSGAWRDFTLLGRFGNPVGQGNGFGTARRRSTRWSTRYGTVQLRSLSTTGRKPVCRELMLIRRKG